MEYSDRISSSHARSQNGWTRNNLVETSTLKRVCYFSIDNSTIATNTTPDTTGQQQQQSSNDMLNKVANLQPCRLNQVDGSLCTHVILTSVYIDPQGNSILANQELVSHLKEVDSFKRQYPHVRVMLSIRNGQCHPENHLTGFQRLASGGNEIRQNFACHVIEFLQKYNLDGCDLDWQFPNFPTNLIGISREYERTGLTKIISSLRSVIVENFYARQAIQQHQLQSQVEFYHVCNKLESLVEPYLLTATIAAQESVLRASYELKQLACLCDWLNVMSYDYFLFKAYTPFTGPIAPLEPIVEPYVPILGKLSLSSTVGRLIDEGVLGEKICMGIPTYARAYRLIFKSAQPVTFTLALGTKLGASPEGHLSYREVLDILGRDDTVINYDERAKVPYLLTDQGYTWISYENARSVREKVNYIARNQLAGYITYNLNNDDYLGSNKTSGAFPLHRAMYEEALSFTEAKKR